MVSVAPRVCDAESRVSASPPARRPIETPTWLAELSREQQSATPYLGLGFRKSRVSRDLHDRIYDQARRSVERFRPAASREEIRSIEPARIPRVRLHQPSFDTEVESALKADHEAWAEMPLEGVGEGGLWADQRGSYILRHVDRTDPWIISSTLCIDCRLDEPWPVWIEDIGGRVHEIDLAPGELLLYEGARLVHGRPWPLRGDSYLSLSVHYRPVGLGRSR